MDDKKTLYIVVRGRINFGHTIKIVYQKESLPDQITVGGVHFFNMS